MKKIIAVALVLYSSAVLSQGVSVDPPLSKVEIQMVADLKDKWHDAGMPPMTESQIATFIEDTRKTQLKMMGMEAGMRAAAATFGKRSSSAPAARTYAAPAQHASAMPAMAERTASALAADIAARSKANHFTQFERRGDGLSYDGTPFIDADGTITEFGADARTGWVSYFVDLGDGSSLVKYHNVHSRLRPIVIGQSYRTGDTVTLQTVSGESARGEGLIPTSRGVLVLRD